MITTAPIIFLESLTNCTTYFSFEKYGKIFILVDENTKEHCWPLLLSNNSAFKNAILIEIQSGEQHKNLSTCEKIWQLLFWHKADRNSLFINLGGGVIGDMGGFIASLYKRGIDFINFPTTLLAMVDATVGGKTGIDFLNFKNGIGLFQQPAHIFIHTGFLKTLSEIEILSGFAEIIKHALISPMPENWQTIKSINEINKISAAELQKIIEQSIKIKSNIVKNDYKETGERKVLNFGHTIGHAIESYALQLNNTIPHGYAIAWGIIAELQLAQQYCNMPNIEINEIEKYILTIYKNIFNIKFSSEELKIYLENDKKNIGNQISFSLLERIGKPTYNIYCNEQDVKKAINYLEEIL
jgi:3-dehydroquinate synthase